MTSKRIILLGTVHLDPHGHTLLLSYLHKHQPNQVTVEISPYALEYRKNHSAELLSRLNPFLDPYGNLPNSLCAVEAQIRIPYEYAAARAYCTKSRAKLVPIGDNTLSQTLLAHLEKELMVTENLAKLAKRQEPSLVKQVQKEWMVAQQNLNRGPILGTNASFRFESHNRHMSHKIRKHAQKGLLIHIGGWQHLKGLGQLLYDLDPQICSPQPQPTSINDCSLLCKIEG